VSDMNLGFFPEEKKFNPGECTNKKM